LAVASRTYPVGLSEPEVANTGMFVGASADNKAQDWIPGFCADIEVLKGA